MLLGVGGGPEEEADCGQVRVFCTGEEGQEEEEEEHGVPALAWGTGGTILGRQGQ